MEFTTSTGRTVELREDDITRVTADAIVNAANSALAGGGGVDGAIHRAGGPGIMAELAEIRHKIGRCPAGHAVATTAGRLQARFVFHTVGPVYRDGKHGESELLASCYRTCMQLADDREVASIAFPAISTGVYGYPIREATEVAVREVVQALQRPDSSVVRAIFVVFDRTAFNTYAAALKAAVNSKRRP